MPKITVKEAVDSVPGLNAILNAPLPADLAFRLHRYFEDTIQPVNESYLKMVESVRKLLTQKRLELVASMDAGDITEEQFNAKMAEESETASEELNKVLAEEVEVHEPCVYIEQIKTVQIAPNQIAALKWLIKDQFDGTVSEEAEAYG